MKFLVLFGLITSLVSCSDSLQTLESSEADNSLKLAICRIIKDDANGEIWEEVEKVSISQNKFVDEVFRILDQAERITNVAVPMSPYKDLIICHDQFDERLFAIAQKTSGKCVRISSFERLDNGNIFIGGEEIFDDLIYSNRTDLAEGLRELFRRNESHSQPSHRKAD